MILLNNSMFDDGSFECFNFWIADQDGTYQVDASSDIIKHLKGLIQIEMKRGNSHLNTSKSELIYGGVQVLEIQWG